MGTDGDGGPVAELAAVAEAKRELFRREEVAVRQARNWCEYGCGNRIKVRAYRERRRATSTG